jgi:3-hydroxyacyl-CoA dehydrogenase
VDFYRIHKTDNKKILEAINLETGEYSPSKKVNLKSEKVELKI